MNHLTIILKPTNRCNARCIYCSNWDAIPAIKTMTEETLEKVFQRIEEWQVYSKQEKRIKIIWHGGEPTLMPIPFFDKAIQLQEHLEKEHGLEIENNIQSNLLFLNKEKLEMLGRLLYFKGKKRTIGTSFDPIPGIRTIRNGDYMEKWKQSIGLLRDNDFPFGIVYVVHSRSIEKFDQLIEIFNNEFPGVGIRFNPLYKEGKAADDVCSPLYITARQWGEFLVRLYRKWEMLDKEPAWQPLMELDRFHIQQGGGICCDYSGKCGISHIGIDADGSIYSCGRGIDRKYKSYGNIYEKSFRDIMDSPSRKEMINRAYYLENTQCNDCKWWRYCHGGCPMDAAINNNNDIFNKTNFCVSRKTFFKAVFGEPG